MGIGRQGAVRSEKLLGRRLGIAVERGQKQAASRIRMGPVLGSVPSPVKMPPKPSAIQNNNPSAVATTSAGRIVDWAKTPPATSAHSTARIAEIMMPR